MNTFGNEHTLPRLPLPTLEKLCSAVPALASPLLEETVLADTLSTLADFASPGGAGEKLHRTLERHAAGLPGNGSWLRALWDDMYATWRDPLPLNLNYFFRLDLKRWNTGLPGFLLALANIAGRLGREDLEPEQSRAGFLSMEQACSAFYTRIPGAGSDTLLPVRLSLAPTLAVTCQGYWFVLALQDESGNLVGEAALSEALRGLREEAGRLAASGAPAPPVAAMTSAPRERAAAIRAKLLRRLKNRLALDALEQSLFTLCLDAPYGSVQQFDRALMGGPARGRWFDKSLQVIATENELGVNLEHAGCDAGIWAYLLNLADRLLLRDEAPDAGHGGAAPGSGKAAFRLLSWDVPENLEKELLDLEHAFAGRLGEVDLVSREYPGVCRERLKALRTSPDAFLQVAFQVAQYKVFGTLRSAYEAVSMRGYAQGRTECARGSTNAAGVFAEALRARAPHGKLLELYRIAERVHLGRLSSCQRGRAVERYMFGLQKMHEMYGKELGIRALPALFTDPGWRAVTHNALSTSGMGAADCIRAFGFAPVARDGFGIGYVPGKSQTSLVISSFSDSGLRAEDFARAFAEAAESLVHLLSR